MCGACKRLGPASALKAEEDCSCESKDATEGAFEDDPVPKFAGALLSAEVSRFGSPCVFPVPPGPGFAAVSPLTDAFDERASVIASATSAEWATLCQASDDLSWSSNAWIAEASCEAMIKYRKTTANESTYVDVGSHRCGGGKTATQSASSQL